MAVVLRKGKAHSTIPGKYTSEYVANRAGINYRTLMRLVEKGLLKPDKAHPDREKIAFHWTRENATLGQIVGFLWGYGFTEERVREVIAYFQDHPNLLKTDDPFDHTKYLITDREMGGMVEALTSAQLKSIPNLIDKGCLIVPFEACEKPL